MRECNDQSEGLNSVVIYYVFIVRGWVWLVEIYLHSLQYSFEF